jgi:hypothetical protein
MTELEKTDWWDSRRRSRDTLVCVFCVGLAFVFIVFSPSGWVGLAIGLVVGSINVYFSLHPDTKFYEGRLATTQPRVRTASADVLPNSSPGSRIACYLEFFSAIPSSEGLGSVPHFSGYGGDLNGSMQH